VSALLLTVIAGPVPAADRVTATCRHPSDDAVCAGRALELTRSSGWIAGDYDGERWCAQVFLQLRTESPAAELRELRSWAESRSACEPFHCPQYRYHCTVHVRLPPAAVVRASAFCD
jgi:hypothetical protein